ncbi:MAG TPA: PilN domain-containing protein [Gemmatimonadaceae bacterium]|nr:PilN domain-containing protein [Gemmatimonadaceae bacterium]
MIEINLLPGGTGKKKSRSGGGPKVDLRAAFAGLAGNVRDPYLIAAVASLAVGAAVVGGMYVTQQRREAAVVAAEEQAVADSTRFANYTKQRRRAEATRDTVLRQINVIRAIDGDRFIWPHVLDEVSSAMPEYTWLTAVSFTGTPQGTNTPAVLGQDPSAAAPAPRGAKGAKPAAKAATSDTAVARDEVQIMIEGQTVDIEAITRFMRQLEASPFVSDVQLGKSVLALEDGTEVTAFTLQAKFVRQDSSSIIRRAPLAASVVPTEGN